MIISLGSVIIDIVMVVCRLGRGWKFERVFGIDRREIEVFVGKNLWLRVSRKSECWRRTRKRYIDIVVIN